MLERQQWIETQQYPIKKNLIFSKSFLISLTERRPPTIPPIIPPTSYNVDSKSASDSAQ